MKINGELVMIHKNANHLDQTPVKIMSTLQHKPLFGKDLILNNNSVIVNNNNNVIGDDERVSTASAAANHSDGNDDNNNDYLGRRETTLFRCPVCQLDDFPSRDVLNDHVKYQHPGYKPTCENEDCGEVFPSMKSLAVHSAMHMSEKCAIRNLKIRNYLENKNSFYHKLTTSLETSQTFRCNFCREYCTGPQFMVHWKSCKHFSVDEHSDRKDDSETEDVKNSFLAGFHLQSASDSRTSSDCESNRSPGKRERESATRLMDAIQTVSAFPKHPMFFVEEEKNADEDDDPFKMEVRDMKRRGEFPCRICQKIFRNLRALKGHARIHISGNRGVRPYECNICSFTTNDKTMVIRHIRNHNGDHPYKCQLCYSTFTTKANCERHLRNAHRKTSREDIKKLLLDLNNKPQQNNNLNFKTKLQTLLTGNVPSSKSKVDESSPVLPAKFINADFYKKLHGGENNDEEMKLPRAARAESRSDPEDSSNSNDSNNNTNSIMLGTKNMKEFSLKPLLKPEMKSYTNFQITGLLDMRMSGAKRQFYDGNFKTYNDVIMSTGLLPNMPVPVMSDNGMMKAPPEYGGGNVAQPESDTDEPLDLSVDVLDLSQKKSSATPGCESGVEDLSVKSRVVDETPPPQSRSPHPYFSKNNIPYANFPTNSMVPNLSPFFMPNNNLSTFAKSKIDSEEESDAAAAAAAVAATARLPFPAAKMQPLVFGQLVVNAAERFEEMRHSMSSFVDCNKNLDTSKEAADEKMMSEKSEHKYKESQKLRNNKSSTVKMVMKDGVLVEKQKQRRYRTEKPFSCSYCSGRFTLRSNMDRHVKQQHPGFWRQRQRGGPNRLRRKSKESSEENLINANVSVDSQLGAAGETTSDVEMTQTTEKQPMESDMEVDDEEDSKSAKRTGGDNAGYEEDDDEEDLVIDEESQDHENDERSEQSTSTTPEKLAKSKEENPDLASVRSLLDNVSTQTFSQYFGSDEDPNGKHGDGSEEDEEGLVADSSSEGNGSGGEEKSISDSCAQMDDKNAEVVKKKKSAYSSAPNRVHCDFCYRSFPWASSLRRHTLTHTGQKPYKCSNCPLLFTTKSNCDRHFLRKHRNQLNEAQPTAIANVTLSSAETSSSDRSSVSRLIPSFSTRNVPERPFKCSSCPSSTFSTFQNLKKHIIEKHNQGDAKSEEMASLLEQQAAKSVKKEESANASDNDISEKSFADEKEPKSLPLPNYDPNYCGHISSDLPFKCHLCERGYSERQDALDHMSESHTAEFQHLIYKGALDMTVKLEDTANHEDSGFSNAAVHSDENNVGEPKGKFPDYSSRKVICAFCLRRFWSAEDLRRHMRTHTGERPFACDICQRRFTLKHSMLRHRKKHSNKSFTSTSGDNSPNTDDEEPSSPYSDGRELVKILPFAGGERNEMSSMNAAASINKQTTEYELDEAKPEQAATAAAAASSSSSSTLFKDADKETGSKVCNKMVTEDGVDLIAKLLDIEDKELVDEMLTSKSADDVAKLLGVQK